VQGARRFRPRELLYFCLVAELPIELPKKDRRDLFALLSAGAERRGACTGPSRSLIPEQADHLLRSKPITHSGASRSLNA